MPAIYVRSLRFLLAVIVSCSGIALGTDHWGAHLQRHTCNGSCGMGHRIGSMNPLDAANAIALGADEFANQVTEQTDSTHLFLAVLSADGVKKFSSGVMRSGKIEYGPLTFEMNSTSSELPSEFRMLLDGETAHPETFETGTEWVSGGLENPMGWSRTVQWNCPPLGRHSIQFEVRLKDRLVTSEQLWIEIVAPHKPEVVAVGSSEVGTSPIKPGKIVTVYQDTMVVRFAMPAANEMIMHRPGLEDIKAQSIDECCFQFDLKDLSVGRHGLKFSRVVGSGCSMNSEPSDTLWIQYEPTQALHSIRNENALRRRAIVDEIRSISASSRPAFDASMMYNDVNSKYTTFSFDSHVAQSERHKQTTAAAEVLPPPVAVMPASNVHNTSEGSPTLAPPMPAESPSDKIEERETRKPVVPDPAGASITKSRSPHFVARVNSGQSTQPSLHETPTTKEIESSLLLRLTAQDDADRLSKFEDDLDIAESVWRANRVVSHVVFDAPAYFAQNGYGTSGEEDARNGLVLLEGMELNTQASGHWELKIPYIKSATPAVLHLQIQFKTADGYWKPLTLQPVCFKAGQSCIDASDCNCAHNTASRSASVRCECSENGPTVTLHGYSPILRREVGVFTDVRRRGSVVFGHGYSALEDRRSF